MNLTEQLVQSSEVDVGSAQSPLFFRIKLVNCDAGLWHC